MKASLLSSILVVSVISFGCAQKKLNENLTQKLETEPKVTSSKELQEDATELIDSANLTEAQKSQLKALQTRTSQQIKAYNDESLQLRSVLMKDVFADNYKQAEVKLIQNKIKKVEQKRVSLIIDSIHRANEIMGRDTDISIKQQSMQWILTGRESL